MQNIKQFIICFFLFNNYFLLTVDNNPLLVLTIMVKNEAPVMEATLQPFLDAGLQHYVILDTGSTDNTIQVVQNLFKKYKIQHGHIVQQPFVDFATSRNYALERAEEIFPQAVFFLMIDAEWYMQNVPGLIKFCQKHQNDEARAYLIKRYFPQHQVTDYRNFLFKAHKGARFYGAVHECINYPGEVKVPDDVIVTYRPSQTGKEKSARRYHRDIEILLKEHKNNPHDLRTMFYLGQTYACLKNYKQANFWYEKRCTNNKDDEENYHAHFIKASNYRLLGNWPKALSSYFKAHYIRPQRIEPLICIAQYYLDNHDFQTAFLLARYTTKFPVPLEEQLPIAPAMYDFIRHNILARAAWFVGEYEVGQQATLKALQFNPAFECLQTNLVLYKDDLQHLYCNTLDRRNWCSWCNGIFWLTRPSWFNFCCLAHRLYPSNRCNLDHGITWRSWVGPSFIDLSNNV